MGIFDNIGIIIEAPLFFEHLYAKENLNIHLSYMGAAGTHIKTALRQVSFIYELP